MGRYRKPTQEQILEGAPGKRPIPVGAIPQNDIGEPPRGFPKDAREIWKTLAQEWSLALTEADRSAFGDCCKAIARQARLERLLDETGMFDFDHKGMMIVSAPFRALQQNTATLQKYFAMFGATPGTRGRVPQKMISYPKARQGGLEVLQGGKQDP